VSKATVQGLLDASDAAGDDVASFEETMRLVVEERSNEIDIEEGTNEIYFTSLRPRRSLKCHLKAVAWEMRGVAIGVLTVVLAILGASWCAPSCSTLTFSPCCVNSNASSVISEGSWTT
jgi:hypothetical protein